MTEPSANNDPLAARKKAMDYLARREHSCAELCRKMETFGFASEVALDAVEQLQKDGLQSDRRFVEAFVQSRVSQGKGPTRIRADLLQRGIRDSMIQEAVAEFGQDWFALARQTRQKTYGVDEPLEFRPHPLEASQPSQRFSLAIPDGQKMLHVFQRIIDLVL